MVDSELKQVEQIRNSISDASPYIVDDLYQILSDTTDRVVAAACIQAIYIAQITFPVASILYLGKMDEYLRYKFNHTTLYVLNVFDIEGKGVVVTGFMINGEIKQGDEVILKKADGRDIACNCTFLDKSIPGAGAVSLGLDFLHMSEVSQGDLVQGVFFRQSSAFNSI